VYGSLSMKQGQVVRDHLMNLHDEITNFSDPSSFCIFNQTVEINEEIQSQVVCACVSKSQQTG